MQTLQVAEIFKSLQGESTLSGVPFAFIRLTGCNLRCRYCDSRFAWKGGRPLSVEQVLQEVKKLGRVRHVLVTGGEPLLQPLTPRLVRALARAGYDISIETNGETDLSDVRGRSSHGQVRIIMDIKTPGSGVRARLFRQNLRLLKTTDEVKFVLTSRADYLWARKLVRSGTVPTKEILFSAASGANRRELLAFARQLAEWIVRDELPVRLQLQLHKLLWGFSTRGV